MNTAVDTDCSCSLENYDNTLTLQTEEKNNLLSEDEQFLLIANRILREHKAAFEELAK